MRVVMVSKAVIVGAYQRKLEELARLPGIELTAVVPPLWRDSRGETRLERVFVDGYRLLETPIALNGHFHAHFYPRLSRTLTQLQPDLLHVDEEPYNLAAWQAMQWAVSNRCPALFFTWQNLDRRYPPPFNWMERYSYRHAAYAIAGNHEAARVLAAKGYRGPSAVIPQFGVDPQLFSPATTSALIEQSAQTRLIVGYAGGLVPEKGVDLLLKAVAICNRTWSGAASQALTLRVVGSGQERLALETQAQDLGIDSNVRFLGRLASTEMPAFYRSIDVLVVPSRTMQNWKEQFGRVLIEAMACGIPVVGSDSGEIPAVIGEAGLIFPEEDAEALAAQLECLAQNRLLRAELGRKGRNRVLALYTHRRVAQATYDVYRACLT
jgi:glycosyltransferase involved in cell wall biosynthesis